MQPEQYNEQNLELAGWRVHLTSYKLGERYYAKADNVSPGASLARAAAATREEAEQKVIDKARQLLARTRRQPV